MKRLPTHIGGQAVRKISGRGLGPQGGGKEKEGKGEENTKMAPRRSGSVNFEVQRPPNIDADVGSGAAATPSWLQEQSGESAGLDFGGFGAANIEAKTKLP